MLQALQGLLAASQASLQHTPSTQLPLSHFVESPHEVPSQRNGQSPPQSTPVSLPFFILSEQLTHVCVAAMQVGFVPVQSASVTHATHWPAPSQTLPAGDEHASPFAMNECTQTLATHESMVHGLLLSHETEQDPPFPAVLVLWVPLVLAVVAVPPEPLPVLSYVGGKTHPIPRSEPSVSAAVMTRSRRRIMVPSRFLDRVSWTTSA
jgi:hypothetical protein